MHDLIVIEKSPGGERAYDIYSRLLKERIIMLNGGVTEQSCNSIIAQMLFLESEDPNAEIIFYINSMGGTVTDGMAVVDTMEFIQCDVRTIVAGQACSMGSVLAASGTKGKRMMLRHGTHMIHQILGGHSGQASDLKIYTEETLRWKTLLNEHYAKITGQPIDVIEKDTDRDNYLTAEESIKYGLADEIIKSRKKGNIT